MKRVKVNPNTAERRRRTAIVGLVLFVVLDLVLVAWAASAANTPRSDSGASADVPVAIETMTPSPTPTPTPTPTPIATTASPTPQPVADAVAPTRFLAAVDGTTAWRASTGACPASHATIELTSDGGATWKRTDASGPTGASTLIGLSAQSAREASAVALALQGCAPEYIRTYVAGDNWARYAGELSSTWYLVPGANGKVHAPSGDVTVPCPAVVGLAVGAGSDAAVLCAAHDIYRTTDNGAHWAAAVRVPAAVAISPLGSGSGYAVAAVGAAGCAGTQIVSLDAAGSAKPLACVGTTPPPAGSVAISGGGGALWLWGGDATERSSDGGTTWR